MKSLPKLLLVTFALFGIVYGTCHYSPEICNPSNLPIDTTENSSLKLSPDSIDTDKTHIVIHKGAYKLMIYEGEDLLKTYPVVFGYNPEDDKKMEGDGCTPEGVFKLRATYDHAKWTKFMWIDYPNEASRSKFKRRKANGEIPETASIGGEIGIHGTPEGYDHIIANKNNWTLGCISLNTNDIKELYALVKVGTSVSIFHD